MKSTKKIFMAIALVLTCALTLFTLCGCNLQLGGSGDGSGTSQPSQSTTQYTVSFDSNGGSSVGSVKVAEGGKLAAPASPTKSGYVFAGWYNGEDLWVFNENTVKANVTLKAKWIAASDVKVATFNSDGGTIVPSQLISAAGKITEPAQPVKAGYTFAGWYNGQLPWNFQTSVASSDVTLTAKWILTDYTITYELGDGAVNADNNPATFTILDGEITLSAPSRDGYVFIGWTAEGADEPNTDFVITSASGDVTVVANWEVAPDYSTFNISYVLAGGTNAASNPKFYTTVGDTITLEAPTRAYYKFIGWTYEGMSTPALNVTIDPVADRGDKTYTANWEAIKYTIKYVLTGGEHLGNPITYTAADLPITIKPATKANSHFFGWYADENYTVSGTTIAACADITLYAKFVDSSEGLTYKLNDEGTGYIVTGYTGSDRQVYIAYTYNGLPVVEIGDKAFMNQEIASVIIPSGIKKIGKLAFSGCSLLTSVSIPNTIRFIGSDAFKNCALSTSTVYGGVYYVGDAANPYTVAIRSSSNAGSTITLHNDTKIIYSYALENAANATNIVLPEGLSMICDFGLSGLSNIAKISIPDTLKYVGSYAFQGCTSLVYSVDNNARYLGNENNPYMVLVKVIDTTNLNFFTIKAETKIICAYAFSGASNTMIMYEGNEENIYIVQAGNEVLFAPTDSEDDYE